MSLKNYLIAVSILLATASYAQQTDTIPKLFHYVEQMPSPGYGFNTYLADHLQYPDRARVAKLEGKVVMEFIVNEDGTISNAKVVRGIGDECDVEALKVIKNMPRWQPGKQNGMAVKVLFTLPIIFKLTEEDIKLPETVYSYVEQMPIAGYNLQEYLSDNLHYPDSAQAAGIEGKVVIKFVVAEDGGIVHVRAIKGIGGGCDEEALRVVKGMPKWRPGKQSGVPVPVYLAMPIVFASSEKSASKYVTQGPKAPEDLQRYLKKNIEYPKEARIKKIEGRVIVKFTINEDGSISDATVLHCLGGGCDEEAVRVVTHMPNWKPAIRDGKAVKTKGYTYPIEFKQ